MISSTDSLLQQIKIKHMYVPFIQEGVSGTSFDETTYDGWRLAGCWTAVVDDDGDGGRDRRGAVVGDQVDLLVLLLHARLHLHKFILLSHEIYIVRTDCFY